MTDAVGKVLEDDRWSWEDEDQDGDAGKRRDVAGAADVDELVQNSRRRGTDPVATMLDRLYGDDDHATGRLQTALDDDIRCWDRYADRYYDRYVVQVASDTESLSWAEEVGDGPGPLQNLWASMLLAPPGKC